MAALAQVFVWFVFTEPQLLFPAFPLEKAKAQLCPIDFYPALGSLTSVSSINFNFPSGREPLAEGCSRSVNPALRR